MNLPEDIDLLLVGHGLAGALLADALERRGKRVAVADPYLPFGATKVAAGILNPIIGPKLNAPWRIKDCLERARETYERLGKAWDVELFREFRMIRIFKDQEMADRWKVRKVEAATSAFMGKPFGSEELGEMGAESPFGAGEVLGAGALRARELVDSSRRHLSDGGLFYSEAFDPQDAPSGPRIVFCEGFRVRDNPWFSALPFAPVRGEILELADDRTEFLNGGTWFLPQGSGKALAGSTFDWDDLESGPTDEGAKRILEGLSYLNAPKPSVTGRRSGVRPGTRDRMPIMGTHPKNPSMSIFNGFGSRGGTLIPLCAELFAEYLLEEKPLPEELDLRRFPEANSLPSP
jgi:glycine/D-amino acid oxidase-like deaminating enzyme